jgi:hypothetical protein
MRGEIMARGDDVLNHVYAPKTIMVRVQHPKVCSWKPITDFVVELIAMQIDANLASCVAPTRARPTRFALARLSHAFTS